DSDVAKRKFEDVAAQESARQRAKRTRVSGDLALGEIGVDGKKWENDAQGLKDIFRGAEPGVRTFNEDDIKETTDEALKALRVKMGKLELYENWIPNGKWRAVYMTGAGWTMSFDIYFE